MKNKRYTSSNPGSLLWREKLNTLIERDILFTALLMASGLIYSEGGFVRGLPFPWFITGPGISTHYRPDTFLASLVVCALIVVFLEFINAVIRAATEPKAFSNISRQSGVYANIYDDNDEIQYRSSDQEKYQYTATVDHTSFDFKDTSNYKKALRKNERAIKKAVTSIPVKAEIRKQNKSPGTGSKGNPLSTFILIFIISTIIIIFSFAATMINFTDIFDDQYDDDTDTGNGKVYDTIFDSPFYNEEGYLEYECDNVITMLTDEDEEGISAIGDGDASAILNAMDWENIVYIEDIRSIRETEPQEAFIRYKVTEDGKDYMFAIKFTGDDIAENPENAVVTGISLCPYDPWEKYYAGDGSDYTWSDFKDEVEENAVSVGDDRYFSYSILTW